MSTPSHTLNLCGVLSESKRIINAHSRHFLALSVLFLLPLAFSLIVYPTLQSTLSQSDAINSQLFIYLPRRLSTREPLTFTLPIIFTLFVLLISLCAVATITYSTYHGFYGRPVKFIFAIKSLFYSFLPLIVTAVVFQVIVVLISVAFVLFVVLVTKGIGNLGFEVNYNSRYFIGFCVLVAIVYGLVLVWVHVNWKLAGVIVVVESKWGFEPLRRSTYLVRGMRGVSLSVFFFFGAAIAFWLWGFSTPIANWGDINGWRSWVFILQTVVASSFVTSLMLYSTAANTVLYMYCKALHGELAFEIAEEFAREYVSLPFDDEKVPHVVSVVQA